LAIEAGVQLIRAHEVGATVQAIRMAEALLARRAE
jgi:dihydropteroate synthase